MGTVEPLHVPTQEDLIASGGEVEGIEGGDDGVTELSELVHRIETVVHVQRNEGLLGVGRIANEMNAEGKKI